MRFLGSMLAVLLGGGVALSQAEGPSRAESTREPSEGPSASVSPTPGISSVAAGAVKAADVRPEMRYDPGAGLAVCNEQRPCGPPGRFWASAEYLLWWTKDDHLPPLVTTAPAPGAGVLGQPGTVVLFGDDTDYGPRHGLRLTAGTWLDDCQTKGVEVSAFCLLRDSEDFEVFSTGTPVIARPFFDVATGAPGSELVAFPGLLAGGVSADTYSKLKGAEVNGICNLKCCYRCDDCGNYVGGRLDLLVGVRYLRLTEGLTVHENILVLPGAAGLGTFPNLGGLPLAAGTQIGVFDRFRTENRFYGGQVGLRGEYALAGGFFVNATGKVAYGVMEQEVDIEGGTAVVGPAGTAVAAGGLLAQATNIGHYERSRSAMVSEFNVNVGYQVDRNLRVFAGYTYLFVGNVVRPGDAIDFTVNSTRVPTSLVPATGPARPAFIFRDSDFWAQGFSIGAELRY